MNDRTDDDGLTLHSKLRFAELVESTGIRRFAQSLGVTTRQVNRMLAGAQPNPVERIIRCLQSADPEVGDRALEFICQEMGGHFIRRDELDVRAVNAVTDCARELELIREDDGAQPDIQRLRKSIQNLSQAIESLRLDDLASSGEVD